jgi:hypothetical protein
LGLLSGVSSNLFRDLKQLKLAAVLQMASVNRGNVVLQPTYFTSSVYVKALRDDITTLVHNFHEQYKEDNTKPFALFKTLWNAQGWKWMHFKVFDDRTRETFLNVTVRLFLGAQEKLQVCSKQP